VPTDTPVGTRPSHITIQISGGGHRAARPLGLLEAEPDVSDEAQEPDAVWLMWQRPSNPRRAYRVATLDQPRRFVVSLFVAHVTLQ